jgi:hypothetical protein
MPFRRHGHITGTVYLLHFTKAFRGVRHYLGFVGPRRGSGDPVELRLREHLEGKGNGLVAAAVKNGAKIRIARRWSGVDGFFEMALHRRHDDTRLCPICARSAR